MSERGHFRGGGRGAHRGGRGGGRGGADGGAGGRGGSHSGQQQEKPKKENILDLTKYMDKQVTVKFNGGREGKLTMDPTFLQAETDIMSSGGHFERL